MRLNLIVLLIALFILGAGVFSVADKVTLAEKKLHKVEVKIAQEHENLRVLNAEWTYLTSPTRLEKIASTYLEIKPIDGGQYIELAAVPMRDFIEKQIQEQQNGEGNTDLASADQAPAPVTAKAAPVALPAASVKPLPTLQATPINAVMEDAP